jgi:WD40 repeat protein
VVSFVFNVTTSTHLFLGEDGSVRLWDLDSGQCLQEIDHVHCGPVVVTLWIPSYQEIKAAFAIGYSDGSIYLYSKPDFCVSIINRVVAGTDLV